MTYMLVICVCMQMHSSVHLLFVHLSVCELCCNETLMKSLLKMKITEYCRGLVGI